MSEQVSDKKEEMTKCLNCGTEFCGNFCPQCGQRADTKRFTIRFIFTNLLQAILSNDGGVWITLKTLFTHPGQMMVDIINGKRKSYFSPFPMLFLALSLYIVIFTFTGSKNIDVDSLYADDAVETFAENEAKTDDYLMATKVRNLIVDVLGIYQNHYTASFILTIPIYILAARVCYGRKNRRKYNWGEYCIPIVYSLVLLVLYQCLTSIVYYFSPDISGTMEDLMVFLKIIVFTALFQKMFEFKTAKMVWRSFLMFAVYWAILFTIILVVSVTVLVVLYSIDPENLG